MKSLRAPFTFLAERNRQRNCDQDQADFDAREEKRKGLITELESYLSCNMFEEEAGDEKPRNLGTEKFSKPQLPLPILLHLQDSEVIDLLECDVFEHGPHRARIEFNRIDSSSNDFPENTGFLPWKTDVPHFLMHFQSKSMLGESVFRDPEKSNEMCSSHYFAFDAASGHLFARIDSYLDGLKVTEYPIDQLHQSVHAVGAEIMKLCLEPEEQLIQINLVMRRVMDNYQKVSAALAQPPKTHKEAMMPKLEGE